MYPGFVEAAIPIGASLAHSAQGIAYNLVGREAIMLDPAWQGGDYYGSGRSPERGLSIARMVGMITYQSDESMRRKFHRERVETEAERYYDPDSRFQVENYLHYQGRVAGQALRRKQLPGAVAGHGPARPGHTGRGSMRRALEQVSPSTRALVVGISSDILFPTHLQRETVERLKAAGRHAEYSEISRPGATTPSLLSTTS